MRFMFIFTRVIGLSLCVLLLIFGVSRLFIPSYPPVDIGFFDEPDCIVSCWQGLRPKQSTMRDIETFYAQRLVRPRTYVDDDIGFTEFSGWSGEYEVMAFFKEDELVDILLRANNPRSFTLRLDTILTILGNPEHILISYIPVSYEMGDPYAIHPFIKLYYPNAGYIFHIDLGSYPPPDDVMEVCIEPDDTVSELHVIASGSIQDLIMASYAFTGTGLRSADLDIMVSNLDTWGGYKCYSFPYSYPFTRIE